MGFGDRGGDKSKAAGSVKEIMSRERAGKRPSAYSGKNSSPMKPIQHSDKNSSKEDLRINSKPHEKCSVGEYLVRSPDNPPRFKEDGRKSSYRKLKAEKQKKREAPQSKDASREKRPKRKLRKGRAAILAGLTVLSALGFTSHASKDRPVEIKNPPAQIVEAAKAQPEINGKTKIEPLSPTSRGDAQRGVPDQKTIDRCVYTVGALEGDSLYQNLGNNLDGAGLSMGIFQWNLASGTLQPMLKEFAAMHKNDGTLDRIFGAQKAEFLNMLNSNNREKQIAWGEKITNREEGAKFIEPWNTKLTKLLEHPDMIKIQIKEKDKIVNEVKGTYKELGLKSDRAFGLLLDLRVHTGPFERGMIKKVLEGKKGEYQPGSPEEKEAMKQIIESTIKSKQIPKSQWDDIFARAEVFINGNGKVHGKDVYL